MADILAAMEEIEILRAENARLKEALELAIDAALLALRTGEVSERDRVLVMINRATISQ